MEVKKTAMVVGAAVVLREAQGHSCRSYSTMTSTTTRTRKMWIEKAMIVVMSQAFVWAAGDVDVDDDDYASIPVSRSFRKRISCCSHLPMGLAVHE